jgi:AAA-like domain/TIR domain
VPSDARDGKAQPAGAVTNTAPAKLFISYKRSMPDDETLAHAMRDRFAAAGHDVFIDVGMKVGTDWVAEIARRIAWCDFLIVLLSQSAVESEMVQAEVRLAHQRRRRDGRPAILPVRVNYKGALDYELDAYLSRTQYVMWTGSSDTDRVIDELQKSIAEFDLKSLAASPSLDQLDLAAPGRPSRDRRRPQASEDPRVLLPPGGTIRLDDQFYVRREPDDRIVKTASLSGQTLVIKAPRQMGKSSLLIRYLAACKAADKQFAFIDFQSFSEADLAAFPALARRVAQILLRAFRLPSEGDLAFTSQLDLSNFVEDKILDAIGAPITIAMDEVDRLLGRPHQSDFFSMLRLWHNQRAQPLSPWEHVDLAMVIATEPYLLISEADRSPFNVTPAIELGPFKRSHLDQINDAYGHPLGDRELDQLHELLCGQPYLTRLAFYRLISLPDLSFEALMDRASDIDGPFGEHLRSRLFLLQQQRDMPAAMRKIITMTGKLSDDEFFRLRAAGLVERRDRDVVPANLLYARFFKCLR